MSDTVFNKVAELIAAHVKIPVEDVKIDSTFEELGVDSLVAVSLIYDLEDEFEIEIPNEEATSVGSPRDIVESLARLGVK